MSGQLKGLQNQGNRRYLLRMSRTGTPVKERVAAIRQRRKEAGRGHLYTDLPNELIEAIDRIKAERGAPSRAPIIEEAVRLLIEKEQRA